MKCFISLTSISEKLGSWRLLTAEQLHSLKKTGYEMKN